MKILFFSSYFYPYISGITTYPYKILSHLAKKNKVTVLTFLHDDKLKKEEKSNGITIFRLPYLFRLSKGFISPQSLPIFLKHSSSSDIIILNVPNFEGLLLAFIGKLQHKKIIALFHCEVLLEGGFISKIINLFLNLSVYAQLFLSNIIVAYTKDYIDHIPVGKLFKNKIKIILPPVEKLTVNKNKLNQLLSIKKNKIWLGYAGRIAKEKGLEYLILATLNLKKIFKNNEIELVFAGAYGKDVAGEEKYYKKIKLLLEKEKIFYRFFGNLNGGNLAAFYKSADVLVLPSINKTEAFGMVQVEAMLLGTPVIATNLPGVRIPISLTEMGLIVDPKNRIDLTKVIEKIINHKNKYSNPKLISRAQQLFNINKTYKFYDHLISEENRN